MSSKVTGRKSVPVAVLLTVLFGPLGMFYATVRGALVMIPATLAAAAVTFGLGGFVLWPVAIVWSALAAHAWNTALDAPPQTSRDASAGSISAVDDPYFLLECLAFMAGVLANRDEDDWLEVAAAALELPDISAGEVGTNCLHLQNRASALVRTVDPGYRWAHAVIAAFLFDQLGNVIAGKSWRRAGREVACDLAGIEGADRAVVLDTDITRWPPASTERYEKPAVWERIEELQRNRLRHSPWLGLILSDLSLFSDHRMDVYWSQLSIFAGGSALLRHRHEEARAILNTFETVNDPDEVVQMIGGGIQNTLDWILGAVLFGFAHRAAGDESSARRQWSGVIDLADALVADGWFADEEARSIGEDWIDVATRAIDDRSLRIDNAIT